MQAAEIIKVKDQTHFHSLRSKGIGASDVPVVLGLSKYKTPYELWKEKTGKAEQFEGNEYTRAGHKLEQVVSEYFEEESGHRIIKKSRDEYLVVHHLHDFIRCHPDREYFIKDDKGRGLLECKTKYYDKVEKGDLPLEWYTQNQYQLGVMGYNHGSVAWLSFSYGIQFDYEEFEASPQFFEYLVNEVGSFWHNNVLADTPPAAINSEDTLKMFPSHVAGKSLIASDELHQQVAQLKEIKTKVSMLTSDIEHLSEPIKMAMQDHESVVYDSSPIITWRKSKDSIRLDEKALKEKYPEIYAECSVVLPGSRRFLLK